jgi:hypothetical protein
MSEPNGSGEQDSIPQRLLQLLAEEGIETSGIHIEIRGPTAILTGTIVDPTDRGPVVGALSEIPSVNQVVDMLCVGSEAAQPQICMKQGEWLTQIAHLGKIRQSHAPRFLHLAENNISILSLQGTPLSDPPFHRPAHALR